MAQRMSTGKTVPVSSANVGMTSQNALTKVRTLVIATDEELMIARDTKEVLEK